MPIERPQLDLIAQAASSPYLSEQRDELRLIEEVRRATEQDRLQEQIFERRPDLAAAAYFLIDKTRYGGTEAGQRTLAALKETIHRALSPNVNVKSPLQRAFSIEYRLRGILHENPSAIYGLVHYLSKTNSGVYENNPSQSAARYFTAPDFHEPLLGPYRFGNQTMLGIFDFLQPNGFVFESVRSHLSDSENLARLDQLVVQETTSPELPKGLPLEEGLQILFSPRGSSLNALLGQKPADPHDVIISALRYRREDEGRVLAPRRPGSGIEQFQVLNASLRAVAISLEQKYSLFTESGEGAMLFQTALYDYLSASIGRHASPEETWDYLQGNRQGFPVRDAVIEALGVRPDELDRTMERAARQGIFGEELRRQQSRDSRRPEARRIK